MRLAIVSDIHGNLPALEAVEADMAACGIDQVVNLGDLLSGPLWPAETAAHLMRRGWPTIAGNHERQILTLPAERMGWADAQARAALDTEALAWLAALPPTLALEGGVVAWHGCPGQDLQYWMETVDPAAPQGVRAAHPEEMEQRRHPADERTRAARLLLCGHSHRPRQHRLADGAWLLNPGSVGLQAFDDDHGHPHDMENGSPQARWAWAQRTDHGDWTVSLRAVDYDHAAAARRAEAQGRGDWADALRSGRVGRRERPRA